MVMGASPDPTTVLRGHRRSVKCLAFCRVEGDDGEPQHLLSGDLDGKLRVWDLHRRRGTLEARVFPHDSGFVSIDVCENGEVLLAQGREGCVKRFDLGRLCSSTSEATGSGEPLSNFSTGCYNFCRFSASADGATAALPGSDASVVEVWEPRRAERLLSLRPPERGCGGKVGMCTALCLGDGGRSLFVGYESGHLALFDLRSPKDPLFTESLSGGEPLMSVDVDAGGKGGVAASVGASISQFKLSGSSLTVSRALEMTRPGVSEVRIRRDGRIFVAACWDGRVRVYDYKKGKQLASLRYHRTNCNAVALGEDGVVASACDNVALWPPLYSTSQKRVK